MRIGNVEIKGKVALAPMAGISDKIFRAICRKFGASYVVSEMVSSKGISFINDKTIQLLKLSEDEHPCAIQIFGDDPQIMSESAKFALSQNPDIIDINMGCPAPKVNKSGSGAILMKNPDLCGKIVKAVKNAVNIPVTVKIRKGWDNNNVNAVLIAKICEYYGADAIVIHGKTREQMYSPLVDLEIIQQVKNAVSIPIIGNGDVQSGKDACEMLDQTGCDMVMVGRASIGNPWIFSEINSYLNNEVFNELKLIDKMKIMLNHVTEICNEYGEKFGLKKVRRHIFSYIKGIPDAAKIRSKICQINNLKQLNQLINNILSNNK